MSGLKDGSRATGNLNAETPDDLMEALRREFIGYSGQFYLDAAATGRTMKGGSYYGPDHYMVNRRDGLAAEWHSTVYLNPPYGREVPKWVDKCCQEIARPGGPKLIVVLLPVAPCTRWWRKWVLQATEIIYLNQRVTFKGEPAPAKFERAIAVWRRGQLSPVICENGRAYSLQRVSYWDWKKGAKGE